jgi:LuxR family maltose regulon positive regulatory protein
MTSQRIPDAAGSVHLLRAATFARPTRDQGFVPRTRLGSALAAASDKPLVLVSAPAGTGKTSLVAEWVDAEVESGATCGWISCEEGDLVFWTDVVEGLRRLGVEVPEDVADASQGRLLGRRHLLGLARALVAAGRRTTLVVDGLELDRLDLAHEIDLLLRHTHGWLRLVLVTRVDPVLPLYRYRLAGLVAEARVADLAFSDDEASALLRSFGVDLPPGVVHDLNRRVRGWVTGLRFAARTLSAVPDPAAAVPGILSPGKDVNEYLLGEVLNAQEPSLRRMMLALSVPDVVLPGLAEALVGSAAPRVLAELTQGNAFIEEVRDQPGCYRYYPFFRELLRSQLAYEQPSAFIRLHREAASWSERHGLDDQALEHRAAAGAWREVAAQVVDRGLVGGLIAEGGEGRLTRLVARLPDDVEGDAAAVVRAAAALARGDTVRCGEGLDRVQLDEHVLAAARRLVEPALRSPRPQADLVSSKVARTTRAGLAAGPSGPMPTTSLPTAPVRVGAARLSLAHGRPDLAAVALAGQVGNLRRRVPPEKPAAAPGTGASLRVALPRQSVPRSSGPTTWEGDVPDIVEALTPKELEVLGHLAELLTTEEIADKMFVSINTVRTHIGSILRKLGVNRRNAAIRKGRGLGLIDG